MRLLSSIELPHWLMIAGTILATLGVFGHVITRNKHTAVDPDTEPLAPQPRRPPPSQLDSSPHKDGD